MPRPSPVQDLINALIVNIVAYETRRHQICIDSIMSRNSVRGGTFLHKARTFKVSGGYGSRVSLDPHLWEDMDKFLLDYDKVAWDSKGFWQSLFTLLEPCNDIQDARDALPDFIVELSPQLAALPRQQPEAWTIIGNPRVHRQYLKQREKMEFYVSLQKNPSLGSLLNIYNFEA